MKFTGINVENYTVFEKLSCQFSQGINVFLGKKGTGKTHLMKLLYSAGISANGRITFANKLVRTMLPLKWQLARLVSQKQEAKSANLAVDAINENDAEDTALMLIFNKNTKKWQGNETGTDEWEQKFAEAKFVFIPAKEVLSNNYNLNAAVERGNVQFDDTYLDILNAAKVDISSSKETVKETLLHEIEQLIGGKVVYDASQDIFFLQTAEEQQEFNLVSEGIRKLGLLWILIKNGALDKGAILFWDEPEANINPSSIPMIAHILLTLEKHGVQIFISTHDYFLCKYLDVYRKADNRVLYHSFYFQDGILQYENAEQFTLLEHNAIMTAFISLYRQEVGAALDE